MEPYSQTPPGKEYKPVEIKAGEDKPKITIATCMPKQEYTRDAKLKWLQKALDTTECDLFCLPQEYMGGHRIMPDDLHMDRQWMQDTIGPIVAKRKICLGIGACCKSGDGGGTEDYQYYDSAGNMVGANVKWALPAYDDVRAGGHGALWPETSWKRATTPIELPELRLKIGTVHCWQAFNQTIWPAYSLAGCNYIMHDIKFAPRGWLKNEVSAKDGKKHIIGFGYEPRSHIWVDRLLMASRHQVFCPIGVSCNSWDLGPKMMALAGHVDEVTKTTTLYDVPSIGTEEFIHTFEMLPELYTGLDHLHSAGAYKEHVGTVDGYSQLGELKMHAKVRRLEAHLVGDTTRLDCILKAQAQGRQKVSSIKRGLGSGMQKVTRKKK